MAVAVVVVIAESWKPVNAPPSYISDKRQLWLKAWYNPAETPKRSRVPSASTDTVFSAVVTQSSKPKGARAASLVAVVFALF